MPQVHHVKSARKSVPELGIAAGKPYWYWFRRPPRSRERGVRVVSLTPPRPSQLAGSPFMKALLAIKERIEDGAGAADCPDAARSLADDLEAGAGEVAELGWGEQEKLRSMPMRLRGGPSGQVVGARVEACRRIERDLRRAAGEVRRLAESPDGEPSCVADAVGEVSWEVE